MLAKEYLQKNNTSLFYKNSKPLTVVIENVDPNKKTFGFAIVFKEKEGPTPSQLNEVRKKLVDYDLIDADGKIKKEGFRKTFAFQKADKVIRCLAAFEEAGMIDRASANVAKTQLEGIKKTQQPRLG
jgi:hypothetical protein